MGDTVNLAARLEPANKVYDTEIMMAESTWQAVKDVVLWRQLDKMIVKGKTKPVGVYEVIDLERDIPANDPIRKVVAFYNKGLELYYDRQWLPAIIELTKALEIRPDDGPTKLYISRAQHYMRNDPGKNWDGVFEMTSK
jgi:adenylate cyclase